MVGFPNQQNLAAGAIPVWIAPNPAATTANFTAAGDDLIKTGAGTLLGLNINTGDTSATVKLYDGLTNAGRLLGTWDAAAAGALNFGAGIPFTTGLFIEITEDPDVTVVYA